MQSTWHCGFQRLPDELVVKILSQLPPKERPPLAAVCRRWQRVLTDQSLTAKLRHAIVCLEQPVDASPDQVSSLRLFNDVRLRSAVVTLSQAAVPLSHLSVRCANVPLELVLDTSWRLFAQRIVCLQLDDCTIKDTALFCLISSCPNISHLFLNNCCQLVDNKRLYDADLVASMSDVCSRLKTLDISGGHSFGLTDAFFVHLAVHCKQLEVFNVSKCKVVFHRAIIRRFYFDNTDHWTKASEYVFSFAILMQFFQLNGVNLHTINFSDTRICREHLFELINCQTLKSLKTLVIKHCPEITSQHVIQAKSLRPELRIIVD